MDAAAKTFVRSRAGNRCEYCRLHQEAARFLTFHIEHIQAKQHIVDDSLDKLALACPDCNRFKGPNLTTLDPQTREFIRLFHPRQDNWDDHFEFDRNMILGRTWHRELCAKHLDHMTLLEEGSAIYSMWKHARENGLADPYQSTAIGSVIDPHPSLFHTFPVFWKGSVAIAMADFMDGKRRGSGLGWSIQPIDPLVMT